MSSTAILGRPTSAGLPTAGVHAQRGARREAIRAQVRGRIDDAVVTAPDRDAACAAITAIGGRYGRVVGCAADQLGSVGELTTQLRASGVSTVVLTGLADVSSLVALTNHVHRYGARVAVDATDLVARQPFSAVSHGIDYVIFTEESTGATAVVGRADWLRDAALPEGSQS